MTVKEYVDAAGAVHKVGASFITIATIVGSMLFWLDGRIQAQVVESNTVVAAAIDSLGDNFTERLSEVLVSVNLTRCAVLDTPRLECDVFEGVDP